MKEAPEADKFEKKHVACKEVANIHPNELSYENWLILNKLKDSARAKKMWEREQPVRAFIEQAIETLADSD